MKDYLDTERGWLDALAITHTTTGETLLSGPLADQAALYGVILTIRDLGLPLLEVQQLCTRRWAGELVSGESGTEQQ